MKLSCLLFIYQPVHKVKKKISDSNLIDVCVCVYIYIIVLCSIHITSYSAFWALYYEVSMECNSPSVFSTYKENRSSLPNVLLV
jgi:hypothetical protein